MLLSAVKSQHYQLLRGIGEGQPLELILLAFASHALLTRAYEDTLDPRSLLAIALDLSVLHELCGWHWRLALAAESEASKLKRKAVRSLGAIRLLASYIDFDCARHSTRAMIRVQRSRDSRRAAVPTENSVRFLNTCI